MNIIGSLTLSLLMLPWVDSPDVDYQLRVQVSTGLRALTTSDVVRPDVQHNDLLKKNGGCKFTSSINVNTLTHNG